MVNRIIKRLHLEFLLTFYKLKTVNLDQLIIEPVDIKSPIRDEICMFYDSALPGFTHDDFTPLMKLIKHKAPQNVIELGTAHGNTVANICSNNPHCKVYTVNAPPQHTTGELITYTLPEAEIGKVYKKYGYSNQVIQIYSNTLNLDLSQYVEKEYFDFAIIDACHDTSYVINDFLKIQPYIKKGGMVVFHDTHPGMKIHLHGSYIACMMLKRKGYNIKHLKNTWWGVWIKP